MFRPTHRHADGGYYQLVGPQMAKGDDPDAEWIDGLAYQDAEGRRFWTTEKRWADRFEELSVEQLSQEDLVVENDEEEVIACYTFTVHEAGDVRFLLISASKAASKERDHHVERVLQAQAEMVTQGLHLRAHDFPDLIGDVAAFHAKFGQEYVGKPRQLPDDLHDFRVGFHQEETHEYRDEYQKLCDAIVRKDRRDIISSLEQQLDALVDAAWVILGTADLQFGRDRFHEAWRRVVTANMAKVRKDATADGDGSVDSGRQPKYDIVKPAGWLPPDHRDLVEDNAIFDDLFGQAQPAPDVETNTYNEAVSSDIKA